MTGAMGMLGLCARAGKLVSGEEMSVKAIRKGTALLAIIDEGASANAKKAMTDACRSADVKLVTMPEGQLGQAIGKPGRMAAAVRDAGFAERLIQYLS